jgi:hypothetical protein
MKLEKLPEIDKTETITEESGERIAFVSIHRDEDEERPEDVFDQTGKFILRDTSRNRREYNGPFIDIQDAPNYAYFVPIRFNSRNLEDAYIAGDIDEAQAFWVSDELIEGAPGDDAEAFAKQYIETWNAYASGEVYGYIVKVYQSRVDQDGDEITAQEYYKGRPFLVDDSVWGFYNTDNNAYLLAQLNEALNFESVAVNGNQ